MAEGSTDEVQSFSQQKRKVSKEFLSVNMTEVVREDRWWGLGCFTGDRKGDRVLGGWVEGLKNLGFKREEEVIN